MNTFSISRAYGAGFRLIGRKPLAVFIWGLVYLLIAFVPVGLLMGLTAPSIFDPAAQANANPAAMASSMMLIQPVSWITSILAVAIVFSAIYRAVLTPDDDRLFYLRFGPVELWQSLVQLVLGVMFVIVFIVALIVFLIVGGAAVLSAGGLQSGQMPAIGLGAILVALALLVGIWWLALRFALAGPMTVADRQFRLFESWTLTRGQSLRLFGLALLLGVTMLILYIVLVIIVGMVLGLGAGGLLTLTQPDALEKAMTGGGGIAMLVPLILLGLVLGSAATGLFLAIGIAPWADVYRQLAPRVEHAEAFT